MNKNSEFIAAAAAELKRCGLGPFSPNVGARAEADNFETKQDSAENSENLNGCVGKLIRLWDARIPGAAKPPIYISSIVIGASISSTVMDGQEFVVSLLGNIGVFSCYALLISVTHLLARRMSRPMALCTGIVAFVSIAWLVSRIGIVI